MTPLSRRAGAPKERRWTRRAVLKGLGVTMAPPFLEAMAPVGPVLAAASVRKQRLVCIETVHGSAGSSQIGIKKNLWAPATVRREFDLAPTSLQALEPLPRLPDHRQQHR
jgi:hypothetical protein